MSVAFNLLIHTLYPLTTDRRESLEQPALEPWRCELCWRTDDECDGECEDDAETRHVDSLDAADLLGDQK